MYDPLGLVIPVVIRGRMLFLPATKFKLDWDDPVPSELTVKWVYWWNDLKNLSTVLFDRCVIPSEFLDGAIDLSRPTAHALISEYRVKPARYMSNCWRPRQG